MLSRRDEVAGGHMRDEGKQSGSMVCCDACGTAVPAYDVVNYGSIEQGYRELCNCCFNAEMASALGLERFEHVRLHPVVMTDCAGERHEFHFRIRLLGSMAALDAFELKSGAPGGYQFQILVPRVVHSAGYKRFSFTRASAVVNCQSALTCFLLRLFSQAATSSVSVCLSAIRRSRHCPDRTLSSDSAMSSQLPCFGV